MKMLANLSIIWDWQFFAILPALNVNMHSGSIEFEWLFLGVYFDVMPDEADPMAPW